MEGNMYWRQAELWNQLLEQNLGSESHRTSQLFLGKGNFLCMIGRCRRVFTNSLVHFPLCGHFFCGSIETNTTELEGWVPCLQQHEALSSCDCDLFTLPSNKGHQSMVLDTVNVDKELKHLTQLAGDDESMQGTISSCWDLYRISDSLCVSATAETWVHVRRWPEERSVLFTFLISLLVLRLLLKKTFVMFLHIGSMTQTLAC